jgi:hypothetical protein
LYKNVPNANERLEATFRSLGREYEWDLEKYRSTAKGVDKGNKRRFFKNALRFAKNPIGYAYWGVGKRFASTRLLGASLAVLGVTFMWDGFIQSRIPSKINIDYLNKNRGQTVEAELQSEIRCC